MKVPPLQQTEERKEREKKIIKGLLNGKRRGGREGRGISRRVLCVNGISLPPLSSPPCQRGEKKERKNSDSGPTPLLPTRVLRAKGKERKECKYWSWRHSLYRTGRGVSPKVRNSYSSFSGQTFSLPPYFVFCHTRTHNALTFLHFCFTSSVRSSAPF